MGNYITRAHINPPPRHAEELQNLREDDDQQFTCQICFQSASLGEKKFRNGDRCTHPLCTGCMAEYIRFKLEDEHTGDIRCPDPYCDHTLDPLACAKIAGQSHFLRWCDVLCEAAVMVWESCYCPYRDCNALIFNECGGEVRRSRCPNCKRFFCFRCRTVWHPRSTCSQNTDDELFRRLAAERGWTSCPSCGIFIERVEGCSSIRCRCGIKFCYECGAEGDTCGCQLRLRLLVTIGILFLALPVVVFIWVGYFGCSLLIKYASMNWFSDLWWYIL